MSPEALLKPARSRHHDKRVQELIDASERALSWTDRRSERIASPERQQDPVLSRLPTPRMIERIPRSGILSGRIVATVDPTQRGSIYLVLGRRDRPVDGVWDYAAHLAEALRKRRVKVAIAPVPWEEVGWGRALRGFLRELAASRPEWAVIQVTHLAWSRRGFSLPMLLPVLLAKLAGVRVAAVIHDPSGFGGRRMRDRARRWLQLLSMSSLTRLSERVLVTVDPGTVSWAKRGGLTVDLLVVGSNVGEVVRPAPDERREDGHFTVALFGCSEGRRGREERRMIVQVAAGLAEKVGRVRVVAFGRGTGLDETRWAEASGVTVESYGLVSAEQASVLLRNADALLLVRGPVSSRRGSAIAGIAHALPVVGFGSEETGWPITEGGVVLRRPGDIEGLVSALVRVATDAEYAASLRRRSVEAYGRYFSWESIASRFVAVLEEKRK
jgi:glycosyltransferase involved in cell wall biosynthesis